jgi:hypothetical protein
MTRIIPLRRCIRLSHEDIRDCNMIVYRVTSTSNTPSPYLIRLRTSTTAQAAPRHSALIAGRRQIRTSHTWTGSISSWASPRSHKQSVHRTAMTSRRSQRTTRHPYATYLLNSAREASASSSRVVTLESAVGLAFQITAQATACNLSRFSLHHVSFPPLTYISDLPDMVYQVPLSRPLVVRFE